MAYKVPSTMVRGYCTLFLINNGQWSGGGLPIDPSPYQSLNPVQSFMDQGSIIEMTIDFMENSLIFIVIT